MGHLFGSPKTVNMQTLYFQLERSKTLKDGSHPIYLVLKLKENGKEKRFRHYTGRTSQTKHWIGKGENKRVSSKASGSTITNSRLQTLRQGADAILTNAKNLRQPITVEYFKDRFGREVLGKLDSTDAGPAKGFYDHLTDFINNRKNVLQPSTIRTYETLKNSLEEFEETTGYRVEFETINRIFFSLYSKHLIDDGGLLNNTLAKRIATLKAFLKEMKSAKINRFTDYETFKATRDSDTTIMYLTEKEVLALSKLKLNDPTQAFVRDAFCFACHTGLRFSDWDKIRPENIKDEKDEEGKTVKTLQFTMHKVHRVLKIPLNGTAFSIIAKYKPNPGETIIPLFTNQETNRTLKDLAKLAEIDDIVKEVKKSGANRIALSNSKFDILSCHDARNTFATLYLEKGGRPEVLQRLLGHSNYKQTIRYVKIVDKAVYSDFAKTMKSGKVVPLKKHA